MVFGICIQFLVVPNKSFSCSNSSIRYCLFYIWKIRNSTIQVLGQATPIHFWTSPQESYGHQSCWDLFLSSLKERYITKNIKVKLIKVDGQCFNYLRILFEQDSCIAAEQFQKWDQFISVEAEGQDLYKNIFRQDSVDNRNRLEPILTHIHFNKLN